MTKRLVSCQSLRNNAAVFISYRQCIKFLKISRYFVPYLIFLQLLQTCISERSSVAYEPSGMIPNTEKLRRKAHIGIALNTIEYLVAACDKHRLQS